MQKSLSRALLVLDTAAGTALARALESPRAAVRAHARATLRLRDDADAGFAGALEEAKRVVALGGRVREADGELGDTRIPGIRSTAARAAGASCR